MNLRSALLVLVGRFLPPTPPTQSTAVPLTVDTVKPLRPFRYHAAPNTGPLPCSWSKRNQRKVRKNFRRAIAAGY